MIEIINQQKRIPVDLSEMTSAVKTILRLLKCRPAEVSVVIVTDRTIAALNKKYLNKDRPTDVLAFDLRENKRSALEGEVIVSAVTACRNAKYYHVSPSEELKRYVVHGILHLLGYDDHDSLKRKAMHAKQEDLLARSGLKTMSG